MPWIEAIPNVSEGRDEQKIAAMASAFDGEGVVVLDRHSDPSHHRSVITAVATLAALPEGCLRLVKATTAAVDLNRHSGGVHPRVGALDVLPFVPLGGVSRSELLESARDIAFRIAGELEIPVFLYGDWIAGPGRRALSLAELRRGGLEGLARRLAHGEIRPDFGPRLLHPTAGAIAIGVRDFLVAYNVALATTDLGLARSIAASIRESNGGLRGVQALGMDLPHRRLVQVSMNLLRLKQTSLRQAFRVVREAARSRGVGVDHSEIVGLVPAAAAFAGMREELSLEREPAILEEVMEARALGGYGLT